MSKAGRGSPAGTLGDYPRGDGALTPVLHSSSPPAPYNNSNQSTSTLRSGNSSQGTHGHSHQPSTASSTSVVKHRNSSTLRTEKSSRSTSDSAPVASGSTRSGQNRERPSRSGRATPANTATSPVPNGTAVVSSPSHRTRLLPHMPHGNVEVAPAGQMYWSRAPVWGVMPNHGMRAHSATLVDHMAWIFGGCDERGCWKDIWLFNTETMQWSHPDMLGDIPPPCRAHTATLVDRKIVVFGGGQGPVYYNTVYVLDTTTRRWSNPQFPPDAPHPATRRAHTAVLYNNKIWFFGGGNGMQALNDVWTLTVNVPIDKMRWDQVQVEGRKPTARGYHTANLVGNIMVVMGGSDGRECFSDIWCFNLDHHHWTQVKLGSSHRRLSHTVTQLGSYLVVMGGHDGSTYTSELLFFNLVSLSFEPRPVSGKPPSPRGYHVSLLTDSRLFVFGGFNGQDIYDDVHILDLAGCAYLTQVTSFKIDLG